MFKLFFEHLSKVEKVKTEGIYIKYINQLNLELFNEQDNIVIFTHPVEWTNKFDGKQENIRLSKSSAV